MCERDPETLLSSLHLIENELKQNRKLLCGQEIKIRFFLFKNMDAIT